MNQSCLYLSFLFSEIPPILYNVIVSGNFTTPDVTLVTKISGYMSAGWTILLINKDRYSTNYYNSS